MGLEHHVEFALPIGLILPLTMATKLLVQSINILDKKETNIVALGNF